MGRQLGKSAHTKVNRDSARGKTFAPFLTFFGASKMQAQLKSYLWFVGFLAVTKIVVAPMAKQLNIPVVSDILG
jgi:hypothetical protein